MTDKNVAKSATPKESVVSKVSRGVHLRQAIAETETHGKALADAKKAAPKGESWWADPQMTREQFYAECRRRNPDLAKSDEGRKFPREWKDGK